MTHRIGDSVRGDHVAIKAIFDQIMEAPDDKIRVQYQNLFTWELARHLVSEELVLFPALEKELAEAKPIVEARRRDHHEIKEKLKEFQSMKPSNPHFISTITTLMDILSQHMHDEDAADLVMLENTISSHDNEKLAKSFERTKTFAPTRSHPHAPTKPPFETAWGLLTAPIDNLADMFRRWPDPPSAAL